VKGCDGIAFKTAKANSGLSAVTANKGAINIVADRAAGLVSVSAASDIRAIQLYALDGRKLAPAVSINGAAATINMAQLPAGVSLVKVTLSDNSTAISKIIK
jgi:type II secretory pathway component PulK